MGTEEKHLVYYIKSQSCDTHSGKQRCFKAMNNSFLSEIFQVRINGGNKKIISWVENDF